MDFEVIFDDAALEFLAGLPDGLKKRIFKKIQSAKGNPAHFFERLAGRTDYKLRIGDYRIIADIDTEARRIEVTLIGHRKDIYKKHKRR